MSELKEKAKRLKDISKKYGYELKHTHALEILSQLDSNVNRHVALKKEKNQSSSGFNFSNAPIGISQPFFKGYVIEVTGSVDEDIHFIVTKHPSLDLGLLDALPVCGFRFLSEEEVSRPGFSFRFDGQDDPLPYKTLLEWILDVAKENGGISDSFILESSDEE